MELRSRYLSYEILERPHPVNLTCPSCKKHSVMISIGKDVVAKTSGSVTAILGQRRCPDKDCMQHVFVILDFAAQVYMSYPQMTVEFDSRNIPPTIVASMEEALVCHANKCFTASAIMLRKTMELLCECNGATGPNLAKKIEALGKLVILPAELLKGLDEIRLFGNDAAHVECKTFSEIGETEVSTIIELTLEILKAIYQHTGLIERVNALKKPSVG